MIRFGVTLVQAMFYPARTLGDDLPPAPEVPGVRNPVIIVHAVCEDGLDSQDLARSLRRDGWTVFTPTMPNNGMDGVEANAKALAAEVARVQAVTGARKVDMIGHSQGGLDIRWYSFVLGGHANVGRVVSLGSPHHGVNGIYRTIRDAAQRIGLRNILPSGLEELVEGSAMIDTIRKHHPTAESAPWTSLYSADWDEVVIPRESSALEGARNIELEQPMRRIAHRRRRGAQHLDLNHRSEEAYAYIREALLGPAAPLATSSATRGATALARARRRRLR